MTAKRIATLLSLLSPLLAALATLIALLALFGWAANSLPLAGLNASYIPMAPASALCLVLLGVLLLLLHFWPAHRSLRILRQAMAGVVLLFNIYILLQMALDTFFGMSLDIEKWFVTASLSNQGFVVGRISLLTSILLILLCMAALLTFPDRPVHTLLRNLSQSAALLTFLMAVILIVGYLYGAPLLYGGTITPVALTTAIALFILSAAFLFEGTWGLFSRWILSDTVFARITRRILPSTVLLVLFFEWFHVRFLEGLPPGAYVFSLALGALFTCGFIALITMAAARQIQATLSQAGQALRLSEDKFKYFFENANVGNTITSPSGQMQINQTFAEILGYSVEELQGELFQEHTHPDDLEISQNEMNALLAGEKGSVRFNKRYLKKDGSVVWVDLSSSLRRDDAGQPLYSMATMVDITARRQAEEEIRRLNAELEERVEARTRELRQAQEQLVRQEKLAVLGQMAGSIGHELRNPLGVISSSIYYLKLVQPGGFVPPERNASGTKPEAQPELNEKIKQQYAVIEEAVNTAVKIINDLLGFARLSSADRRPVSVPELVQNTLKRFPPPASLELSFQLPADLPQALADPLHLEQVLGNLVSNACQAMPDGGKLTISARPEQDLLVIAVEDTGTGITPENMQRLFDPLFTTKPGGIGLGLAVSKKMVEANGGRIQVASRPGQGTTFTLYLPSA